MRRTRFRALALVVSLGVLSACGGDPGTPEDQQCAIFVNELCGKLASCRPPSERRDYMDVCLFAQSVYSTCWPIGPEQFDACVASIREADCPAPGKPIYYSPLCNSLSSPR